MKRKAITLGMKIACLFSRRCVLCFECGDVITDENDAEWDHIQALVHGGLHHWSNLRPMHWLCHQLKTARDIAANAKVKRLRGETKTGPKRKIQSPGFSKTHTRTFAGTVKPRAA